MAKKYSKINFVDAVKIITPNVYLNDDIEVSGYSVKVTDTVINSHLASMAKITETLNVSALSADPNLSAINTAAGFGQFFVKQNDLTKVTPYSFDINILRPLGYSYGDYSTSSAFFNFLSGTLLPKLTLNSESLHTDTSNVFANTASGTHKYLISNLSWLYFLNTSGVVSAPSSIVASSITSTFYEGKSYLINDGIKDYQKYLWDNYSSFSSIDSQIIPAAFLSGAGSYTSGNQNLSKLQTFADVIYSPLYIDREDTTVKSAIEAYVGAGAGTLQTTEAAGPFHKFIKAVSYLLRDIDNEVESLERLTSITDCPSEYLPYLANLLGWTLYGNNETSWRNQVANATSLYRKKGTKQGLVDAMNSVLVENPIDVSSTVIEMYESYIPRLMYYLLLTESKDLFNLKTYSAAEADSYGINPESFSPTDADQNIRAAVDSIMQNAVSKYPHLFFIKNEPYRVNILEDGTGWLGPTVEDGGNYYTGEFFGPTSRRIALLGDPNFKFKYRNSEMPIPPWDDEKFYRNCMITQNLISFFKSELSRFCINSQIIDSFGDFISKYTTQPIDNTDLYLGNGYVFFTSSLETPPNYEEQLDQHDVTNYNYFGLWSGKSSTYDFTVCAGTFSSILFQDSSGLYTKNEILDSLAIVDEFSPAKSIPRTRVVLSQNEYASGLDYICPSVRYKILDVPTCSGAMSNYEVCGIYDRGTGYALGRQKHPGFDDSRSNFPHNNVPVFTRSQALFSNNITNSVVNTSQTVPATSAVPRRSVRRRNFYNTLDEKHWFGRDGYNMPSFYNNTSSILDFLPLGIIPSSMSFANASPENLSGVYESDCATTDSNRSYFGLDVKDAYLTRSYGSPTFSSCDQFVRRGLLSDEIYTFFNFHEKKKKAIAEEILNLNKNQLITSSTWMNVVDSFANRMNDVGYDKYISPALDKRRVSTGENRGVQEIYNTYNKFFLTSLAGSALPQSLLDSVVDGGSNILSHTYGPLYFNASFNLDGDTVKNNVAIPNGTGENIINGSLSNPYIFDLTSSGTNFTGAGVIEETLSGSPYYGGSEYIANNFLSGLSFIDTRNADAITSRNKFAIYDLESTEETKLASFDNYFINNRMIYLQTGGYGLPRVRFNLSGTTEQENNILIPEHDFQLKIDYSSGKLGSAELGGGSLGVLIRTKTETTEDGKAVVFFWTPKQEWEMAYVSDLASSSTGIQTILDQYTHKFTDTSSTVATLDAQCGESVDLGNNSVIRYISTKDISTATVDFHTKNQLTEVPFSYGTYYKANNSEVYNGRNVQLHRADISDLTKSQGYVVEAFQLPKINQQEEFIILDKLSVVDKSLNSYAAIPYDSSIPDITKQDTSIPGDNTYNLLLSNGDSLKDIAFTSLFSQGATEDTTSTQNTQDLWVNQQESIVGSWGGWVVGYHGGWNPSQLNSRLWSVVGQPFGRYYLDDFSLTNYQSSVNGFLWTAGAAPIQFSHLQTGFIGDKPWGKIPFCSPCNSTWTAQAVGICGDTTTGPPQQDEITRIAADYFVARKGFLSVNEWSPFINIGMRQSFANESTLYPHIQPGVGIHVWPGSHKDSTKAVHSPLIGLARAGHASDEQWIEGQEQSNGFINNGTGERNPLGFRKDVDKFDYSTIERNLGTNTFGTYVNSHVSCGSPLMIDFTSNRVTPLSESVAHTPELAYNFLSEPASWEYRTSEPHDYHLPTILDPLGQVTSSLAAHSLMPIQVKRTPQANQGANSPFNPFDNDVSRKYNKTVLESFWDTSEEGGHGITFPPMSIYRDTLRSQLTHGTEYSFTVYVRGSGTEDTRKANTYATSAIVTIAPIGSKTSYSRVRIKLPAFNSGETPTVEKLKGGTAAGLTNNQATFITQHQVMLDEDPDVLVNWYQIRVTLPYDAFEEDLSGEINLGLRCTIQAYNDKFDGLIMGGETPNFQTEADATRYTTIPAKLWVWGSSLVEGPRDGEQVGTPTRKTVSLRQIGKRCVSPAVNALELLQDFLNNYQQKYGIWNQSNNSIFDAGVYGVNVDAITYDMASNVTTTEEGQDELQIFADKRILQNDSGALKIYNAQTSSLVPLTLQEKNVGAVGGFPSRLYKGVSLYDNSGAKYSGNITYSLTRKLLRDATFPTEGEELRELSVSGDSEGTALYKVVTGSIPIQPIELVRLFRFFNKLGKTTGNPRSISKGGFNTRVAADSSGVHDLSGGSRVSYRSNPDNTNIGTKDGTYSNYTNIDIIN
tara:strand:+ start:18962 stop:25609 length:6648 start_codon:yes stop_codon:yes gene_type:complete